jgi:hypothetical protein
VRVQVVVPVFFIVTVAEKFAPATTDAGTDWLTKAAAFPDAGTVGVGVMVLVGVAVLVGVGAEVVGVRVGLGGTVVGVGVGVDPADTEIVPLQLLFDIPGSASFPITPTTTLSGPVCRGKMLIVTEERPTAGQVTVVDVSPVAALATQFREEPAALNVTAGWKIAVTVTPEAPAGAKTPMLTINGEPTVPPAGAVTPVTERS